MNIRNSNAFIGETVEKYAIPALMNEPTIGKSASIVTKIEIIVAYGA